MRAFNSNDSNSLDLWFISHGQTLIRPIIVILEIANRKTSNRKSDKRVWLYAFPGKDHVAYWSISAEQQHGDKKSRPNLVLRCPWMGI